jgi:hypothetical protein
MPDAAAIRMAATMEHFFEKVKRGMFRYIGLFVLQ